MTLDGRERPAWRGVIHVPVKLTWIRYSSYGGQPPLVVEDGEPKFESEFVAVQTIKVASWVRRLPPSHGSYWPFSRAWVR
ncbi:MAG: hypothetical protein ACRD2A_19525 [Vicinamibacterales bacterium]